MQKIRNIIVTLLIMVSTQALSAVQPLKITDAGSVQWNTGLTGVSVYFDNDGNIDKITSVYRHPVMVADTRGINKARIIATEKAKALIVRFIKESISTTKVIEEIQNDIGNTTQTGSGETAQISSTVTRQMIESVTEITTSSAQGLLSGVIVLEAGYDADTQEVIVTVGMSKNTMKAAGSIDTFLNSTNSTQSNEGSESSSGDQLESSTQKSYGDF